MLLALSKSLPYISQNALQQAPENLGLVERVTFWERKNYVLWLHCFLVY